MAERMLPPPNDEGEEPVVTRRAVAGERRRSPEMTRKSWYTTAEAANSFTATVDDIHFATRAPKHEVVAALLAAAVEQENRVRQDLLRDRLRAQEQ